MTDWHRRTALELGRAIGEGKADPVAMAEHFLERIARHDADHAVYLAVTRERALAEAGAARKRARDGARLGPLDGVPLAWKDLYDSAGTPTTAGSRLLADRVPTEDAAVLARATRAGMVCLGKTNMTEFAFSGLGINPSFGTPANPFDTKVARCPGGSSSGSAVAVARGLAPAATGSDTGGSVRIPASWNGLVGLKTTAGDLPLDGALPLSTTLDTAGPITLDVADAAALHGVMAARPAADLAGATLKGTVLAVPTDYFLEPATPAVRAAFEQAVEALARAGAKIVRSPAPEATESVRHGTLVQIEADALWRAAIDRNPDVVFHMVSGRMKPGGQRTGAEYFDALRGLAELAARFARRLAAFDAMIAPTVVVPPPPIAPLLADDDAYVKANVLSLSNTSAGNRLRCAAITVPCGGADGLPVGLMLMQRAGSDAQMLRLGAAAERALADTPRPERPIA
jgi:aspartyl-tRNA(Asn)/glutamyl-tRNA(Gln) amidotransferase subunit A